MAGSQWYAILGQRIWNPDAWLHCKGARLSIQRLGTAERCKLYHQRRCALIILACAWFCCIWRDGVETVAIPRLISHSFVTCQIIVNVAEIFILHDRGLIHLGSRLRTDVSSFSTEPARSEIPVVLHFALFYILSSKPYSLRKATLYCRWWADDEACCVKSMMLKRWRTQTSTRTSMLWWTKSSLDIL